MKKNRMKVFLFFILALLPLPVLAEGKNLKCLSLINFETIVSSGAIVNNGGASPNVLNTVIVGMIVVVLILVGAMMFAPKK